MAPTSTYSNANRDTLLPTLAKLGWADSATFDLSQAELEFIAQDWLSKFSVSCKAVNDPTNQEPILRLFLSDDITHPPFWRDLLAFTWDFRTFMGHAAISAFLSRHSQVINSARSFVIKPGSVSLQRPYPDLCWIQGIFTFSTDIADCNGVFRLVPIPAALWKAHILLTNMADLRISPDRVGPHRPIRQDMQDFVTVDYEQQDPDAIIVG